MCATRLKLMCATRPIFGAVSDYVFLMSKVRYDYAKESYKDIFNSTKKILLSNVKTKSLENEYIIRYERAIKRGWSHFDNPVICMLRLLNKLHVKNVAIAGFDSFSDKYNESYADPKLPTVHGVEDWDKFNEELREIALDLINRTKFSLNVSSITSSSVIEH